ncbi:odorant receptor 4-like isoform X1 [Cotesia glomerata]|nr:odorant receptor 4-like isoform X1 [Cotesia glomerata]
MIIKNSGLLEDINYNLKLTKWILKPLGVWSFVIIDCSLTSKLSSVLIIFVNLFIMFITFMPCCVHMIFRETDPAVKIILMGPFGFCLTNCCKYYFIMYRSNIITNCLNHLKADWARVKTEEDRQKMIESVNVGRNITKLCAIFMFSGGVSYHTFMPMWKGTTLNELNETIRPLVYPGNEIFFNCQKTPIYEFIFFLHFTCGMVMQTITTGACHLAAIFATHVCGQVDILKSQLQNLLKKENSKTNDTIDNRIASIIQSHVRILDFSKSIERMLREVCLVEVGASTMIICLLEYYCMTEWSNSETINILTYLMLLTALTFNIFIFCYIGEILNQQCSSIGESTYMINWYKIPRNKGKYLMLTIASSKNQRQLTAGGMLDLSLRSFGNIIKTSVAYLNMLRTVTE